MQGWANNMFVDTDGTIYANAYWDEGAKEAGIFRNGKCVGLIPNQQEPVDGGSYHCQCYLCLGNCRAVSSTQIFEI